MLRGTPDDLLASTAPYLQPLEAQLGHSLMAVQPNCPKRNQSESYGSPWAEALAEEARAFDTDSEKSFRSSMIAVWTSGSPRH
jgi:hypothetical protein